jgi:hypothetical protein
MGKFFALAICLLSVMSLSGQELSKKDTLLIEFDRTNRLLIPKMHTYEEGSEKLLYFSYPEIQRKDVIEIELSFWGIDGEIMDNELIFETDETFELNNIRYKFSRALFFSEDGSGGTWPGSDEYFTDWRILKQLEPNVFKTPNFQEAKPYPPIPEEAIINAELKLAENSLLDYSEYNGSFIIQIKYSHQGKDQIKELRFVYMHGD